MKMHLLSLFLPVLALAEDFNLPEGFVIDPTRPDVTHSFSARRKYFDEKSGIQAKYRARLAEALKHADGAEIVKLSDTPVEKIPEGMEKKYFLLTPYNSYAEILDQKRLKAEKLAQCKEATVKMLQEENDWGGGAFCHSPLHGIRLFRGLDSRVSCSRNF